VDRVIPCASTGSPSVVRRRRASRRSRAGARDDTSALLIVIPGADDLIELREAVLGDRVDRHALVDVMASYRGQRDRAREQLESLDAMSVTFSRDALLFE
jgi:hypothetical protein